MMAIARIHVPKKESKLKGEQYNNYVWDFVLKNCPKWKATDVKLIYMTQRLHKEDTSLIVDIKNTDAFGDFVTKHISSLKHVQGVWLFDLIRPRFFPIPKGTPLDFKRFTISIKAEPQEYANIYHSIMEIEPEKGAIVTYLAYTFQVANQDIIISLIANDLKEAKKFVKKHIKGLKGVLETEITCITRTKRLVSHEIWEDFVKPFAAPICKFKEKAVAEEEQENLEIVPWEYTEKFVGC